MISKLLIGLILASLPAISWILQYYDSKNRNKGHLFKKHYPTYFGDFFFVVFNLFLIYTIAFSLEKFIILGFASLIINYVSAKYYIKRHQKEKRSIHLFDVKTGKSSASGYIHAVFSVIQMFLIFVFILDSTLNVFTYINIGLLFLFLLPVLFISKKLHGKVSRPDLTVFSIGVIVLILKLIFTGFW